MLLALHFYAHEIYDSHGNFGIWERPTNSTQPNQYPMHLQKNDLELVHYNQLMIPTSA